MPKTTTITGYFVDPEHGIAEPRTIERSLRGYYDLLRCDLIDIAPRAFGARRFDIICDDEGLLKEKPLVSAYHRDGTPMLVGPLFVCKSDGHDNEDSLSPEELDYVDLYRETVWGIRDGEIHVWRALIGLDY